MSHEEPFLITKSVAEEDTAATDGDREGALWGAALGKLEGAELG
jgi:hypothetical protein